MIRSTIFSTNRLQLHVLCTFPRFGESGFGETGRHRHFRPNPSTFQVQNHDNRTILL